MAVLVGGGGAGGEPTDLVPGEIPNRFGISQAHPESGHRRGKTEVVGGRTQGQAIVPDRPGAKRAAGSVWRLEADLQREQLAKLDASVGVLTLW